MLSQKEFESMKQGVLLINTSRGCLVDQKALIAQLLSGHLGGAALDVYEEEPLPQDSPLLKMHNVILTPHLGGLSKDMVLESNWFPMAFKFLLQQDLNNSSLFEVLKEKVGLEMSSANRTVEIVEASSHGQSRICACESKRR